MERAYQSTSVSSRLSPPDTESPSRPLSEDDKSANAKRAVEALIYEKFELERRLKELQKASTEASSKCAAHLKELHELRNDREAQRLEIDSLKTRITELRVQISKAEGDALKAKDLKSEISREYSILRRKHEATEHELKETKHRMETVTEEMKRLETMRDTALEEVRTAHDELNDCRSQLHTMTTEAERLQKSNEKLANDLCNYKLGSQEAIKQLDSQIEDILHLKRSSEKQRDDANEKAATLEKQLLTTENRIHKLQCDVKEFEKSDGRLRLQLDELNAKFKLAEGRKIAVQKACEEAEKSRVEAVDKYARLERSQESVLAENRRLRMEIDDLKRTENKSQVTVSDLGLKVAALNSEKEALEVEIASLRKRNGDYKTKLTLSSRQYEQKEEEYRINLRTKEMLAEELSKTRRDLETAQKDYEGLQKIMMESERGLAGDNRRLREELDRTTEEVHAIREEYEQKLKRAALEINELGAKHFEELQRSSENKENKTKGSHDLDRVMELEKRIQEMQIENRKLQECATLAIEKCETLKTRAEGAEETNAQMAHREAEARLKVTHLEGELERLRSSFTASTVSQRPLGFEETTSTLSVVPEEEEGYDESEVVQSEEEGSMETISRNSRFTSSLEVKKRTRDYAGVPLVRSERLSSSTSQLEELQPSSTISMGRTLKSKSSSTLGTMRHDIPHRFKSSIKWKHSMCGVCFEAIPSFNYLYKCDDCGMCTHRRCASEAIHTCGLPTGCADFYIENSMRASPSSDSDKTTVMNGWVRMATNPNGPWTGYWATMSRDKLAFFDNEALAVNDGTPRFKVSLTDNNWRIHTGTCTSLRNVEKGLAIEIQTKSGHIYLLTPTLEAKQRWVKSLQRATDRQMYSRRRSSQYTVPVDITPFLTMPYPEKLWVNSTLIVEGYLLIAAQEGLYTVPESNTRASALVRVAGLCDVYYMEVIEELDRLLIVHGSSRELLLVDLTFLGHLRAGQTPRVQVQVINGISNCHLMVSNKNSRRRFVYAANTDKIFVLTVDGRSSSLSILKEIRTHEPCICLLPTTQGFVFGADGFHIVTIDRDCMVTRKTVRIDRCPFDCPVSALNISDNEILLAYYNFGVFVDLDGRRTRQENVEWSRAPLEFVYTEPFLYIVHYESLEIREVLPRDRGIDSKTFKKEHEMYKCKNSHFVGLGERPNDVIFAITGRERAELHKFNLGVPVDCLKY
ncbi:hypothetical protein QR680_012556 [Steinernema hermaphroditum]|uniref:Non-specific serine/threonine protein kinase n=1 Tax=Steinernema hermaphroditum TaxID=289476 RepID=A0AA39M0P5_9BILA|nr:hypothetical protein QR680_012556 [Steinernema hermaphroditum]